MCDNDFMIRYKGWVLGLALLVSSFYGNAQEPAWRVDLRNLGSRSEPWGAATSLKFYGPFLVIYTGSIYGGMHRKVVLDKESGRVVSEESSAGISLPEWDECPRTLFRKPFPEVNIVDCRKQMTIEQIGGIGLVEPRGNAEYYLHEPGKDRVLLLRAHCITSDPRFVGDDYILVKLCSGKRVVVNKQGHTIYDMPKLVYVYVAPNREGTRFAAQERDSSFLGQFADTTDRKRMKVFRTSDGRQLFEHRWGQVEGDLLNDGRVALSDDGALAALIQGWEVIAFAVPSPK